MQQLDMGPWSRSVWIWRGTLPDARYEPAKVLSLRVPAASPARVARGRAAAEFRAITGPRSIYGLLGAEFMPSDTPELAIEVVTSGDDVPHADDKRWIRPGSRAWIGEYVGLPDEYGQAVLEGARDVPEVAQLGGGTLRFDCAAYHVVDSNAITYARLARIVVRLLLPDAAAMGESDLVEIVREVMRR